MKKRVFVSFDYDYDKSLKELLIGQSRYSDSPFEVIDFSLKEADPEWNWEIEAEKRIKLADIVLVIVGKYTYRASGVLKEIKIARRLGKKIVQIIGQKDESYQQVANAGRIYSWTWPNLKTLLS